MISPSFTFTIDRTSLGKSALVYSAATGASVLGVVSYREPASEVQNFYAEGSSFAPRALLATMPAPPFHSLVFVPQVASQAAEDTALADLREALGQFAYGCTVTLNGSARVTTCNPGSMTPANDRTRIDLAFLKPLWSVTIPIA